MSTQDEAFKALRTLDEVIEDQHGSSSVQRLKAWRRIAAHPFFAECYESNDSLIDAMIAKLDDWHKYEQAVNEANDVPPDDELPGMWERSDFE